MKKIITDKELLIKSLNEGKNSDEIAEIFNCKRYIVNKTIKNFGLTDLKQPRKTSSFIGTKSGRLTVEAFSHYNRSSGYKIAYWKCICECGNSTVVQNSNITSGNVKSCGCLIKENLKELHKKAIKDNAPFLAVLSTYKNGASSRGFSWELTEDQFKKLTSSNCYYCGEKPSKIKDSNGGVKYRGTPYVYNGLDRVNNYEGYTLDNVVPCCWVCNMIKGTFNKDIFINKVHQISNNLKDKQQKICNADN